jgi:type I restriction enzyme S subunit
MIDGLKPYPAMRESGVPWLGAMPAHWDIQRNGRLFALRKEVGFPELPILEVSIGSGVRRRDLDNAARKQFMADRSQYQRAARGDIAYNMMRMWQGAVGVVPTDGLVSPAYIVARPYDNVHAAYFAYLFRTAAYLREIEDYSRGIVPDRNRLYWESFKQLASVVPPNAEQKLIVRFLDFYGLAIARIVQAKRTLIILLNEQKQAIVHRTVTRGLDPNVRLKSSGVEWLGDVPKHWKVMPIKRAFVSMEYGISEAATDDGHIRLLTMGHIKKGSVVPPDSGGVTHVDPGLLVVENDLLFNRTNSAELVGKVGLFGGSSSPITFASYLVRMRPRPEHLPTYLNLLLNDPSVLSVARREAIPSLHQSNLNPTRYGRLQIALPPLSEQETIIRHLDVALVDLNSGIDGANREIDLLREYRNRLIADVVTGKLDVRAAAAVLPETTTEPEKPAALEIADEDELADIGEAESEEAAA